MPLTKLFGEADELFSWLALFSRRAVKVPNNAAARFWAGEKTTVQTSCADNQKEHYAGACSRSPRSVRPNPRSLALEVQDRRLQGGGSAV